MAMGGVVMKAVVGMSVPKKWVRVTYAPPTTKPPTNITFLSSSSSSSSSVSYSLLTNNHETKKNKKRDGIFWRSPLGLSLSPLFSSRHHKCRSLSSSSPEDRPDLSSSSSSDSGGMGSESHHPSHRKFLTLPTVLTLGRVAAVPLLIASAFLSLSCFFLDNIRSSSVFMDLRARFWLCLAVYRFAFFFSSVLSLSRSECES